MNQMFNELIEKVRALNLPAGTFAIFGSGPMAVRGLREPNDIDLIITKETYWLFKKRKDELEKEGIDLWDSWGPGDWDVSSLIKSAEMIDGMPYVTLDHVIAWKEKNNRPKDIADIKIIKKYLDS